jgi:pimeloyl-ACP methyl ester carboxylesterase
MSRFLSALALILAISLPASAEEVVLPYKAKNLNLLAEVDWAGGKDRVAVILHGTLSHNRHATVANLRRLLAAKGFSTLAPNLSLGVDRRQGNLDCAVDHRHRHEDALGELGAWMDWLKGQGVKQVDLVGFSRGGNQAAWFVAEGGHPLVKRLALVAPATWTWDAHTRNHKPREKLGLLESLKRAKGAVQAGRGETLFKELKFLSCGGAKVSAESLLSYYDPAETRRDTPGLLPGIGLPYLVVAASADTIVPDLLPRLKEMPEVQGKFVVVDGADHFFNDLFAEDAVDAIAAFLKK